MFFAAVHPSVCLSEFDRRAEENEKHAGATRNPSRYKKQQNKTHTAEEQTIEGVGLSGSSCSTKKPCRSLIRVLHRDKALSLIDFFFLKKEMHGCCFNNSVTSLRRHTEEFSVCSPDQWNVFRFTGGTTFPHI